MPITVPGAVDHTGPAIRTFYLVEFNWPSGVVYYSSREQMAITAGPTFLKSGIDVRKRQTTGTGYQEYEIIFPATSATTTLFLNQPYQGEQVIIYEGAGAAVTSLANVVTLLDGIAGGFQYNDISNSISCIVMSGSHTDKFTPLFLYDVFDWIPENGTVISLQGNETNI